MLSILGCGAIGSLIARSCHQHQLDFQLILRRGQADSQKVRIRAVQNNIPECEFEVPVYQDTGISNLILPVKAYQVETALSQLHSFIDKQANIILMHNGLGTAEQVRAYCPHANIILASTTHGAYQDKAFSTVQTGLGESVFGFAHPPGDASVKQAIMPLIHAFGPAKWAADIQQKLWQKLAVNSVINPITALWQVKNGALLQPEFTSLINHLVDEFCLVSETAGYDFKPAQIKQSVLSVAANTSANWSSMNRDIYFKRPSEIDFINGYLLKQAAKYGIALPHNQKLYQQIKQAETSSHF